jgi:magnesium transporter
MELHIFKGNESPALIESAYYLKRRASVFRRILKLTLDVAIRFQNVVAGETNDVLQDVQEEIQHHLFHLEELHENTNNVLNLHVSLASQKTNQASSSANEVMRILTIFSVFLMPLNLIASIYGMNFQFMPELHFKYGYPMVLVFMFIISLSTYFAFKRRGWIK